ncbi:MAG TPA: DinB family protein [Pyrinomonadaceae bacterium]|jgi:uncharacterized damage-inducible protein DinB|nr:DinB family protein [Pyrinomonadaceae bacterium]
MTTHELQHLVEYLSETPVVVERMVSALDDEERRFRPPGVEFSALENVCHLLDIEREGYAERIHRLLGEDGPVLPDIDGGRLARERDYNSRKMETALEAFARAREGNVRIVKGLAPDQLERRGVLETVGPITLAELLRMMREHDTAHRRDISELRELLASRREESASQ